MYDDEFDSDFYENDNKMNNVFETVKKSYNFLYKSLVGSKSGQINAVNTCFFSIQLFPRIVAD